MSYPLVTDTIEAVSTHISDIAKTRKQGVSLML
jgi:hypothetical protein